MMNGVREKHFGFIIGIKMSRFLIHILSLKIIQMNKTKMLLHNELVDQNSTTNSDQAIHYSHSMVLGGLELIS